MQKTDDIKVKSYQATASLGGWAGAGRTLWAISTVGIGLGLLVGLVAPFVPVLFGLSTLSAALGALPASLAIFAATGLTMGFGGGLMLGRISGSTAAVAEEAERRSKEWNIRQLKGMNPNVDIIPDAPEKAPSPRSLRQRASDFYNTYFNPRVGAVMTVIGAVGGLIMGAAFIASTGGVGAIMGGVPLLTTLTGISAGSLATAGGALTSLGTSLALVYSAGVGAAFGALWNLNLPKITTNVTGAYGTLISGKPLGREWEPPREHGKQPQGFEPQPGYSEGRQYSSYQELLAQQAKNASQSLAKH